jgi:hypothetical protein
MDIGENSEITTTYTLTSAALALIQKRNLQVSIQDVDTTIGGQTIRG